MTAAVLSKRQRVVAELAARHPELDNRALGRLLGGMSANAVGCSLSRIYKALGIGRRAELARALGWVR
ncbi:hypothetical protein [Dactylosporangium salmoneum]|uniref:HTH luxR-type domain-containing protein n=1 Tax=Dactylosporangium salmoneum TaxID=53361 RepID=A0ABN3G8R6_9ACTN